MTQTTNSIGLQKPFLREHFMGIQKRERAGNKWRAVKNMTVAYLKYPAVFQRKKGDRSKCENYRGIILLNMCYTCLLYTSRCV